MRAAVILMLASMIAVTAAIVVAAEMSKYADRCVWAAFSLCEHRTGQEVNMVTMSGFKTKGTEHRRIDDVIGVIPLTTTDDCVMLITRAEGTASVKGSEDEVLRQLNPEGCKR